MSTDPFSDYIADALTSYIAYLDCSDFVVKQDDDIVYVDMEGGPTLYLITVREAHVQAAAGEDPQADREKERE